MRTYSIYVEDDRYKVPTLQFVRAKDEFEARQSARAELSGSPHHVGVEVWEEDRFLFRLVPPTYAGHRSRRISG